MSDLLHLIDAVADGVSIAASEWLKVNTTNENGHIIEEYEFSARKIGYREHWIYKTNVNIIDGEEISIKRKNKLYRFKRAEIKGIITTRAKLVTKFNIVAFSIVAIYVLFIIINAFSFWNLLYGILAAGLMYYHTLINAIRIITEKGEGIDIYYMKDSDAEAFITRLKNN